LLDGFNHTGLVNLQKAIEHGPVEIVDLPRKNGDFPVLNMSAKTGGFFSQFGVDSICNFPKWQFLGLNPPFSWFNLLHGWCSQFWVAEKKTVLLLGLKNKRLVKYPHFVD